MRTEKEIKWKLRKALQSKATAKASGTDESYRIWCKAEKLLRWILESEDKN